MNENDKTILELKKKIAEKKAALKASERFSPITNCSLELNGIKMNLHYLGKDQIISALVDINAKLMSAKNLGLEDEIVLSGYKVQDWITDLKARLMIVNRKSEQDRLDSMEAKLHHLLTSEAQVSIEIEKIKADL